MVSTILNVASQRRPGTSRLKGNRPLQQLRQPGDVDSYTPRLIAREQPRGGTAAGLVLIIDIAERLTVGVADDEARAVVFDVPRRREAASLY